MVVRLLAACRTKCRRWWRDIAAVVFIAIVFPPLVFQDKEEAQKVIREFVDWWLE